MGLGQRPGHTEIFGRPVSVWKVLVSANFAARMLRLQHAEVPQCYLCHILPFPSIPIPILHLPLLPSRLRGLKCLFIPSSTPTFTRPNANGQDPKLSARWLRASPTAQVWGFAMSSSLLFLFSLPVGVIMSMVKQATRIPA